MSTTGLAAGRFSPPGDSAWLEDVTGAIQEGLNRAGRFDAATRRVRAVLAFGQLEYPVERSAGSETGLTHTLNTMTDPGRLRRCLASIRLTRVAVSRWELAAGVSEVAVPVPDFGSGGMAVAALQLEVPNLRTDLKMASSLLTVAAHGPSRELAASKHTGCLAIS